MREARFYDNFLFWFDYYQQYRVEGNSMLPVLQGGDIVLAKKTGDLKVNDIVVANHPFRKTFIIKRITKITTDGKFFLSGDNPDESTDSRTFGEISEKDILGKVIYYHKGRR
jgi:nickel-type superoxide dismutase maturation protease